MIKAWDKDGKEIDVTDMASDEDIDEGFQQYLQMFSMISQKYKVFVTKLQMEGKSFVMTVEQK